MQISLRREENDHDNNVDEISLITGQINTHIYKGYIVRFFTRLFLVI
jgi:hypothetical protein